VGLWNTEPFDGPGGGNQSTIFTVRHKGVVGYWREERLERVLIGYSLRLYLTDARKGLGASGPKADLINLAPRGTVRCFSHGPTFSITMEISGELSQCLHRQRRVGAILVAIPPDW